MKNTNQLNLCVHLCACVLSACHAALTQLTLRKLTTPPPCTCFRGSSGVIHRAIEKATGRNWGALFMKARPVDREFVKREVELMNDLHHHKLLQLHEAYEQPGEFILMREL